MVSGKAVEQLLLTRSIAPTLSRQIYAPIDDSDDVIHQLTADRKGKGRATYSKMARLSCDQY